MKRFTALGIAFLANCLGLPTGALAAGWTDAIDIREWIVTAEGPDVVALTRPALGAATIPIRVWVRYEYRLPQAGGSLSMVDLTEYDCSGGRSRHVQRSAYAQHNAMGSPIVTFTEPSPWQYVQPGSIGDGLYTAICNR